MENEKVLATLAAAETEDDRAAVARRQIVVAFAGDLPAGAAEIPRLYAAASSAAAEYEAAVAAHHAEVAWEHGCDDTPQLRRRCAAYAVWGAACVAFQAAVARAVAPGQWLTFDRAIVAIRRVGVELDGMT